VAADNLRSYVRDSDPKQYWEEGCQTSEYTMAAIMGRLRAEHKAALCQEAEGC
jgi:hypothetical protein